MKLLPFTLGICWLAQAAVAAPSPAESEYFLRVWRTDDGLPPLTTATLIEAPEGYLWMEAALGLVRFDGEHFTTFPAAGIGWPAGAKVAKTFADSTQGLWVTLSDGSLWRERGGKWTRWGEVSGPERISFMYPARDAEGGMFAATTQKRLLRCTDLGPGWHEVLPKDPTIQRWLEWAGTDGTVWFTKKDQAFRIVDGRPEATPFASPDQHHPYFYSWKDGSVWIIGSDYISHWQDGAFRKLPAIPDLAPQQIAGLLPAPPHGVWISTVNRLFFLPSGETQWRGPWPWATRAEQRQLTNLSDVNGHHWIATYGFGFLHVSPDGLQIPERLPPELAANRILNFIEDRERNIWAVAEGSGLVRLRARRFAVHRAGAGLTDPEVLAVAEDAAGQIWAGSRAGGADIWADRQWQHITLPPGDEPAAGVTSILPHEDGSIWVGTFSRGVWQRAGDAWIVRGTGKETVRVLFADRAGAIWMGGSAGLYRWTGEAWQAAPASAPWPAVRALAEDATGRLWAATVGGIWRSESGGSFGPVSAAEGLPAEAALALCPEPDGTLWIGFASGLAQWRDGRAVLHRPADGLPVSRILGIFPGGGDQLWVSSPDGLVALDRQKLTAGGNERLVSQIFTRADGLPTKEASGGFQPSVWRGRDGRFWLPTHQGLVEFKPETMPPPSPAPPVVIEEAIASHEGARTSIELPPLRASAALSTPTLATGLRRLEFRFTSPSLSAPEKALFRWRMDGLDDRWSEPSPQRIATYPYLPPGSYTFRVIACNGDGVWNETGAALAMIVPPLWHERSGFWIAVAGVAAGLALIVLRARYRRRIERLQLLSALDHERARIAQDIHDDLGATLTQISMWSAVAQKRADDTTAGQLGLIRERSNDAVRSLDQIVWAVNPRNDTIRKFVTYLCQAAGDFFRETSVACRIDLVEPIEDGVLHADVRHHLVLAAREACTNALRHAEATEISLHVEASPHHIFIRITDNGRGFDPAITSGDGEGLSGMKRRLTAIGGQCVIESKPGHGTRVLIQWRG